jgi:hypothetical protein
LDGGNPSKERASRMIEEHLILLPIKAHTNINVRQTHTYTYGELEISKLIGAISSDYICMKIISLDMLLRTLDF